MATSNFSTSKVIAMPPPHQFTVEGFLCANEDDYLHAFSFAMNRLKAKFSRRIPPDEHQGIAVESLDSIALYLIKGNEIQRGFFGLLATILDRDAIDYIRKNFDDYSQYKLQLQICINDVSELKNSGHSRLIVASALRTLHFRAFNYLGEKVCDSDEKAFPDEASRIEELRYFLKDMWPPHDAPSKKARRIDIPSKQARPIIERVRTIANRLWRESRATFAGERIDTLPSPASQAADSDLYLKLEEDLNSLDVVDRTIVNLSVIEELSERAIAEKLGRSKSDVRRRLVATLRILRRRSGDQSF